MPRFSFFPQNIFSNKVAPISEGELRYYELLRTINRGDLLSDEEMRFVWGLQREHLLVILKLYNRNMYNIRNNNTIHIDLS